MRSVAQAFNKRHLRVTVKPGIFANERIVQFEDGHALAVHECFVGCNIVQVTLLEEGTEFVLVDVPAQTGGVVLKVSKKLLVE